MVKHTPILRLCHASSHVLLLAVRSDSRLAGDSGGCWRAIGALDVAESVAGVDLGVRVTLGPGLT